MPTKTNRTPWAYTGTDDSAEPENTYSLSSSNSIPALVVWLTMTVSTDIQNNATKSQVQALADAVGLTENSVIGIRKLLESTETITVHHRKVRICDAFVVVAKAFLRIGKNQRDSTGQTDSYPPTVCPLMEDITSKFGPVGGAVTPSHVSPAKTSSGSSTSPSLVGSASQITATVGKSAERATTIMESDRIRLSGIPVVGALCGLALAWRRKRMLARLSE